METWRVITTWGAPPDFNMGLDEALLLAGSGAPTLRLYTWSPDTLSLGYFQRYDDVPGKERAGAVVRRVTGGGAIHHVGELTFSIAADLDHALYRGALADSYARVHGIVARALARHGVEAELRGARTLESDRPDTGMCFHVSTALDLAWDGRKGLGSAQRRRGGRVLHHGSIKLADSQLETGVATLPGVELQQFAGDLLEAFASELDMTPERSVPTPDERLIARRLAPRYLDPAFLRRR